ncbi:MAG: response regulator [Planctomycetes bacterium]|nr:response regulator [Planctomycetota bacterium]
MNHTILLVDDEPNILHSLSRAFRKQPYRTYTSRSAEEAIAILKAHDIDLIVSDENMPGMSGTKLLAWVAEHFPEVVRIVLTGQPSIPAVIRAINEGGVYRFLTKPCDVVELGLIVRQALEQKEASKKDRDLLEFTLNQLEDVEQAKTYVERQIHQFRSRIEQLEHEKSGVKTTENATGDDILATMSHEIRTPLTAILGYTDLMIEENWGPEASDSLEVIRRNGAHLLALLNDILDLSKMDAGKMTAERIECSPQQILTNVVSLLQQQAKGKGISLEVQQEGQIPNLIQTDPTRLCQILVNLVSNAIKFTETGGVRLVAKMDDDRGTLNPHIRFEIIDTGIGLSPEQQAELFNSYAQAEKSTARRFGGTGLGLVISKRLTELLGGNLTVESVLGGGSTFAVTLETEVQNKVEEIEESSETGAPERTSVSVSPLAVRLSGNVLVVEDAPDFQRLISCVLKNAGAEVTLAENGQVGVELALAAKEENNPFDLILMDIQMPVLDGYGATRKLRAEGYENPIVALTAYAMKHDRKKCIEAGCDDYTTKPIERETFLLMVSKYCQRAAQRAC